jgi:hypothetical protein
MPVTSHISRDLRDAFDRLTAAIVSKNREDLENLHDPEFLCIELHGRRMTAEDHIIAILRAGKIEMQISPEVSLQITPDLTLCWVTQTLKGEIRTQDLGVTLSGAIDKGIVFAATVLWRKSCRRWRMLCYQTTIIQSEPV